MATQLEISSPVTPAGERWMALAEIALVFVLFVGFLWGGRDLLPRASVVFTVSMLGLLFWLHRRAGEAPQQLGLRWDTFGAALRWLLPIVLCAAIVLVIYGRFAETARFPSWPRLPMVLLTFVVSGLLQQYVLLAFFARRCARVLSSPQHVILSTAAIFALLHLPNLFLTTVTFVAGILCTVVYRRAPNLFANGLMHGTLSFTISCSLPLEVTDAMRVGSHHIGF